MTEHVTYEIGWVMIDGEQVPLSDPRAAGAREYSDGLNEALARSFTETQAIAAAGVLTEARRKRRREFEAARAQKIREAYAAWAKDLTSPGYRHWFSRLSRSKYPRKVEGVAA